MGEKIRCMGKEWTTNEYNENLSKENKITEDYDKQIRDLKIKRDKEIEEVWKK